ncbi:phage major capsid protein [Asticcacaulis sp.]|uniref:phage major capsid protein n=1 Tax=Asticcacaulis sp. TaxID=1872648 RepID=UPI002617B8FB|nr:phage major capsid protein [Asticcacaulis sp.]
MSLRELQEKRTRTIAELRKITEAPAGQAGDLSEEQRTRFETLKTEVTTLEDRIQRQSFIDDADRRAAGQPLTGSGDEQFDTALRSFSLVRAIASQVPGLDVDCGRERELSQELARRSGQKFQGMAVPLSVFMAPAEQRVMTTTAPSGSVGGNLIATDHMGGQFIDILRSKLIVRGLGARVLSGLTGNVDVPRLKQSATAGWVAENSGLSTSDLGFGKVSMTPKHAGCLTEFSRNMLLQSSPDIEALVRDDFAAVLAEAVDRVAIKGGGSNEPTGVLATSGIGSVTMTAPTWAKVLEFIEKVEVANADTGSLGWATNPKVVRKCRSTLKESGDAGAGYIMTSRTDLADYRLAASNLVPSNLTDGGSPATLNRSALIFGNWSDLLLGYWSAFDLLVNPFEATAYAKGNVSVRGMLTMDIAVRHAESFVACQTVDTQ